MRDAFASFCDALFNQELRDSTVHRLRREGLFPPDQSPPESLDDRVVLICRASRACLLDLIYRFQFISDDRDYQNIASYVNNAPLLNQFVHEFIQNAKDAGAHSCRFVFENDRVLVVNDGCSFTHQNLYAISSFRESDKASHRRGLQIGKFGVGFKSVFRVSRSPVVVTWDESIGEVLAFRFFVPGEFDREYHQRLEGEFPFRFSPRVPERDREEFPSRIGYLFPVPVPITDEIRAARDEHGGGAARGSMFLLPLRPDLTPEQRARIVETVEPESFFFLRMASLEIHDRREDRDKVQAWSKKASALREGGDIELLEIDEREDRASARPIGMALRLTVGPTPVPRDEFRMLDSLIREALPGDAVVRIVTVLKGDDLNDPGHLGAHGKGGLFNGLPVPGVATGLNFHLDAPFNLSADRTNILDDAFNEWLLGRIAEAACRFLDELRQDGYFRNQIFRLVPADLNYGRSKGVGALTQRFAKVHDRLREEARRIGVLPALDGGEPLRPEEALALRGGDAGKPAVVKAIQLLIGGHSMSLFAKTRTKIQGETLQLTLIPERSYEEAVAKALGQEDFFSPRWMRTALDSPDWRTQAEQRDPRWYKLLFIYIGRGEVTDSLEDFLDVPWVPGSSSEDGAIPPREAVLLGDASTDELAWIPTGPGPANQSTCFRAGIP